MNHSVFWFAHNLTHHASDNNLICQETISVRLPIVLMPIEEEIIEPWDDLSQTQFTRTSSTILNRKMGPVFLSILLTRVFLLVGKIFFNDLVDVVFCAFELVFFTFFYSYYSKDLSYILPQQSDLEFEYGLK
ncbi:hypothetical protein STEG23_001846 [Scotinomys teguina]